MTAAPPPGLTPKGRATRERLLAAAGARLARDGALELAAVAADAGVAPSVVYRYFASKDGLVDAVVHAFYDEYDAAVFAASLDEEDGSWLEREAVRLRREVAFLYAHPLGRAVAAGLLHEAAATRADAVRTREHAVAAARNIRHGQRTGQLDPAIDAGLAGAATMGALRALLADALTRDPPPPAAAVADAAVRVGRALLPPPPQR